MYVGGSSPSFQESFLSLTHFERDAATRLPGFCDSDRRRQKTQTAGYYSQKFLQGNVLDV